MSNDVMTVVTVTIIDIDGGCESEAVLVDKANGASIDDTITLAKQLAADKFYDFEGCWTDINARCVVHVTHIKLPEKPHTVVETHIPDDGEGEPKVEVNLT